MTAARFRLNTDPARFGPNTPVVERIIAQAERLTDDQAHRLARAVDEEKAFGAWFDAWEASRVAALEAAREVIGARSPWVAAREAAQVAAWYAAWYADWDAAWDPAVAAAAMATVVRDLVGQGFTQDHYDTLTKPWRTVFPDFDTEECT